MNRARIIAVALLLVGVAVLVYPVIATRLNDERHHEMAREYDQQWRQSSPTALHQSIERARKYNRTLRGVPILDPWLTQVTGQTSGPYRQYLGELAEFDAMARVRVPSVGIELPVRHGTGEEAITTGAGHLYGTSLPVGGEGTHAVMTSHTGLGDATLFDRLADVQQGEVILVDVAGSTLAYRVDDISTVVPTDIQSLRPVPGHDYLTLFTCTPYAVNTHRLLVRAERIPHTQQVVQQHLEAPREADGMTPWMWWMLGGALVGLLAAGGLAFDEVSRLRRVARGRSG